MPEPIELPSKVAQAYVSECGPLGSRPPIGGIMVTPIANDLGLIG